MPRYFTVEEAQALLGQLEPLVRRIQAWHADYREAEDEIQALAQRVVLSGGLRVDLGTLVAHKRRRDASAAHLQAAVDSLHSWGCLLKDIETGLVDFPAQFHGEEVYLCWKLGEPGIAFWHGVEAGFQGRRKIDGEFLRHQKDE